MKNLFCILFIATGFAACNEPVKGRNGVVYKSASQYNDYIVSRQTSLMKNVLEFGEIAQKNLDSAGKMLDGFVKETDGMITEIKSMPSYKGDSSLRNAAINSFNFYKKVFGNDYKQILAMRKERADATEEGAAAINRIVEQLSQEEEKYDKTFHDTQVDFADKNNMKLIKNKMQKKFEGK